MVSCVIINVVCFSTPLLPILTRRFAVAEQDSTEVNREGTVVTLICFAVPRPVPLVDIALLNTAHLRQNIDSHIVIWIFQGR